MLALGLTCLVTSTLSGESQIGCLSVLMLLLNLFSAVQDIAVDTLAVELLNNDELGAGNTIQVVAYKVGSLFSGGLLLYVKETLGWTTMFVAFGSMYFVAVILINNLTEIISEKKCETTNNTSIQTSISSNLSNIIKVEGTMWMILFVLFYKLCERSEQTFALYLVDKNVSKEELAILSSFIRAFSILGSTISGLLLTKTNPKDVIQYFSIGRTLTIFGLTCVILSWGLEKTHFDSSTTSDNLFKYLGFILICFTSFGAGSVTTATFTLMMSLSQKAPSHFRGTHYALLATFEVLGKLIFAAIAGWLTDLIGLQAIFSFFTILAILVVPFISYAPQSVLFTLNKSE